MTVKPSTSVTTGMAFMRTAAFLLVAAIVLADVIKVAECRSVQEDQFHHKKRAANDDEYKKFEDVPQADGAADGEDDGTTNFIPVIQSDAIRIELNEGSTARLPCKVTPGSLDDLNLLWINGTKTIMTDGDADTPNPRITQGQDILQKTLIIEGVTRWDSGKYTCKITSEIPVEITHTLVVLHPPKILSINVSANAETKTTSSGMKRITVKQDEPIQLTCIVDGNPEPKVQWIKKINPQQMLANAQSHGQSNTGPTSPQQLLTTVVSNTNEFRIESTKALNDAGHYECVITYNNAQEPFGKQTNSSEVELVIEYPPEIIVRQPIVNTGETYTAQLICSVHAFPKVKVTWEKEQINEDGSSSFTQLTMDTPNGRYETFRPKEPINDTTGHSYGLRVKQIQSPKDFGQYRCKAENKLGHTYSKYITLTGKPASPQQAYVHMKDNLPELGWNVDSWSPLLEYQLQFRRQQDSVSSWLDVRPQPQVVNPSPDANGADERRYAVSYVFAEGNQQQSAGGSTYVPLILQRGTTYLARIRARNEHGWSDWSADLVFSGVDYNQGSNEINQNGHGETADISKAGVAGGSSGASQVQLQYCVATVAIVLAGASYLC